MAPRKTRYEEAYSSFRLDEAVAAALSRPLDAGLNAAHECCDRHAESRPDDPALYYLREDGEEAAYSFRQLQQLSERFANLLVARGIKPGDRVAGLLPGVPELMIGLIGAWRVGAVYLPLFVAFSPKTIGHRLGRAGARLVLTTAALRAKLEASGANVETVVVVSDESTPLKPGDLDFWQTVRSYPDGFELVLRRADDPFLQMFTSGATGEPRSVSVPLRALVSFVSYLRDAVDLRRGDQLWRLADPGWAYGLYTGVGAMAMGHATLHYAGAYSAAAIIDVILRRNVTHLAGSPTVFRLLAAAGVDAVRPIKGRLHAASSAGEYLPPDLIRWFRQHVGVTLHDHYGQTEIGMVLANHHGLQHPVRLGTVGLPSPGYRVAVLDPNDAELPPGALGVLGLDRQNSPLLWFNGYDGEPPLTGRYYRTGDTVEMGADGAVTFLGRPGGVGLDGAINIRAPSAEVTREDRAIWRKRSASPEATRKKREFVLRVACQMINEGGFAATSMGDIAARLEVSKPTLYYYFQNKDDLLFEALALGLKQVRSVAGSHKGGLTGASRLAEILRTYVEVVAVGYGGGLIRTAAHELSEGSRQEFRRLQSEYEATVAEALSEARAEGAIQVSDLAIAASVVTAALNRVALTHDARAGAQLDEVSQRVVEILFAGLQPRS